MGSVLRQNTHHVSKKKSEWADESLIKAGKEKRKGGKKATFLMLWKLNIYQWILGNNHAVRFEGCWRKTTIYIRRIPEYPPWFWLAWRWFHVFKLHSWLMRYYPKCRSNPWLIKLRRKLESSGFFCNHYLLGARAHLQMLCVCVCESVSPGGNWVFTRMWLAWLVEGGVGGAAVLTNHLVARNVARLGHAFRNSARLWSQFNIVAKNPVSAHGIGSVGEY